MLHRLYMLRRLHMKRFFCTGAKTIIGAKENYRCKRKRDQNRPRARFAVFLRFYKVFHDILGPPSRPRSPGLARIGLLALRKIIKFPGNRSQPEIITEDNFVEVQKRMGFA